MGCETAREIKNDAEATIQMLEGALGFRGLSASDFASTVKSFSRKRKVILKDLRFLLALVDLPTGFLNFPGCPMYVFFRHLCIKRSFSVRVLGTLGVLLGKDSAEKKCQVLFNIYDDRGVGNLGPREIYEMTGTACNVALIYVPLYAEQELSRLKDFEGLKKHKKFAVLLERRVLLLAAILNASLLRDLPTLTEAQFNSHLLSHCAYMLSSADLRHQACKLSEEAVQAFVPQQPAGYELEDSEYSEDSEDRASESEGETSK